MNQRRLKLAALVLLLIAAATFGRFAWLLAEERQQPAVAWVSRLRQQESTVLLPGRCFMHMPWQTQSHE